MESVAVHISMVKLAQTLSFCLIHRDNNFQSAYKLISFKDGDPFIYLAVIVW